MHKSGSKASIHYKVSITKPNTPPEFEESPESTIEVFISFDQNGNPLDESIFEYTTSKAVDLEDNKISIKYTGFENLGFASIKENQDHSLTVLIDRDQVSPAQVGTYNLGIILKDDKSLELTNYQVNFNLVQGESKEDTQEVESDVPVTLE